MGDKRFDDRIKRISVRHKNGPSVEMLAGVGDVNEAAEAVAGKPKASLILALIGGLVGVSALQTLKTHVGLGALTAYPPEMLLEIGMADPVIGASGVALTLCAALAVFSLLRGRKAFRMMSFSLAAMGGALGGFVMAV